jgi:NAD(P)-dependent dehydrogenase (short-subunit alcohol dehydrogenase family)
MLAGKRAVVLGGTGVLGVSMVKALVDAGVAVTVLGRTKQKLDSIASQLKVQTILCDPSDFDQLKDAAESVGEIDILVSAIGGNQPAANLMPDADFFSQNPESLKSVIELNLMPGAILPILAFGQKMKSGSIVTISSVSAELPLSRVGGYGAAKAAVASYTKWAAIELGRRTQGAVRVNAIQPGFFITDQNRFLLTDKDSGAPTERGQSVLNHTPSGRFGEPEDLVGTLLFLCSDASKFVTGTIIPVDGGFTAWWGI